MESRSEAKTRPGFDGKISPAEMRNLPAAAYEGAIRVVRQMNDLDAAVADLMRERLLGFDTETRPSFTKGTVYHPSLLQLAGRRAVYLFQLKFVRFPEALRRILEDPRITKAGVAIGRDVLDLKRLGTFNEAGFVDLGDVAKKAGMMNHGLRGMAAALLGVCISKGAQRSNWARNVLSPSQIKYAATDAWIGRELYSAMKKLGMLSGAKHA